MSIWQAILIAGWGLALLCGADRRLAAVMACNFAVSALWPEHIGIVGLADLATIVTLALISTRGQVIAVLYVICAVINAGVTLLGLPPETTYAILDPIGWVMLVVLANVDAGLRNRFNSARRFIRRHSVRMVDFMAQRVNIRYRVAVDRREDKR